MTVLALAGLAVVLAPWLYRSRTALSEARAEKVRADARADMAAHLHDSVLQTLALIQRSADDPKAVQQLARRQERELRSWLYGEQNADKTLKAALTTAAAEVEDDRGVPVEVVAVGDCELTEPLVALVRAAREALVNAAKHSGADKIDVYAEVDEDRVEVFVRDRGAGLRSRRRGRRPARRQAQHHRQDGPARRIGDDPYGPGRRNRSATGDQPMTEHRGQQPPHPAGDPGTPPGRDAAAAAGHLGAAHRCDRGSLDRQRAGTTRGDATAARRRTRRRHAADPGGRGRRPRHVPQRGQDRDRSAGRRRGRGRRRRQRGRGDRRDASGRGAARRAPARRRRRRGAAPGAPASTPTRSSWPCRSPTRRRT